MEHLQYVYIFSFISSLIYLMFIKQFQPTKMLSDPFAFFFGMVSLSPYNNTATECAMLKKFVSNENDENSLVLFPEGAPTNGKSALLKYIMKLYIFFFN